MDFLCFLPNCYSVFSSAIRNVSWTGQCLGQNLHQSLSAITAAESSVNMIKIQGCIAAPVLFSPVLEAIDLRLLPKLIHYLTNPFKKYLFTTTMLIIFTWQLNHGWNGCFHISIVKVCRRCCCYLIYCVLFRLFHIAVVQLKYYFYLRKDNNICDSCYLYTYWYYS